MKREKTLSDNFPRPLWEADCELRANRLAEVQACADPLNANNQAGQGEGFKSVLIDSESSSE